MKVLILDDHSLFARGLGRILEDNLEQSEINICNNIASIKSKCIDLYTLDLFISDIELPNEDIYELLALLAEKIPELPVLIVSMHNKLSVIKKCQSLGIRGYILKDDDHLIIKAVNAIRNGESYFSEKVMNTLNILEKKEMVLTPKEEEVIAYLAKGYSNQEIADKIFISYNTVKTHRKNIYRKLGLNTNGDIIRYYYDNYIK